jgi:uncharacterized membrane protein YwzB
MKWWTRFWDWFKRWLDDIRTTNLIIVVGVALCVVYVIWALAAATWAKPIDDNTLTRVGLLITLMLAGGVAQFGIKRKTDDAYVTATTGNQVQRKTMAVPAVGGSDAAS